MVSIGCYRMDTKAGRVLTGPGSISMKIVKSMMEWYSRVIRHSSRLKSYKVEMSNEFEYSFNIEELWL